MYTTYKLRLPNVYKTLFFSLKNAAYLFIVMAYSLKQTFLVSFHGRENSRNIRISLYNILIFRHQQW